MVALFVAVSLTGCASRNGTEQVEVQQTGNEQGDPRDPLESVNRTMWDFNWEVLDAYILRPITVGYVAVMPQFARTGLLNAVENLQEPGSFINNMLQGKFDHGMDSLARFVINSTVGLLGTIDVAERMGIARQREDFGEVLGKWGVDTGPYLMLPALGPSDPRSFTGDVVDGFYSPAALLTGPYTIARFLIDALEDRAAVIELEPQLEQAVDDYAFIKNAYFENLEFRVTDGASSEKAIEESELEDFEEFESMLEDLEFPEPTEEELKLPEDPIQDN
ncbi:VacJ family lipoprotein [Alteromonas aestuariivivens]|uniref:VacJ family lipoprotein n=1 Tax=Alteromonas aestuariivivens TaxID=1938339 RepID=A0A3D8M4C6_9ALTE|nr:VacJ family lipoprotein [Alteromonas aestuariivivens]